MYVSLAPNVYENSKPVAGRLLEGEQGPSRRISRQSQESHHKKQRNFDVEVIHDKRSIKVLYRILWKDQQPLHLHLNYRELGHGIF